MVKEIKNELVTFIPKIKLVLILIIFFSVKGFCTGYVTSVSKVNLDYKIDNYAVYDYNATMQTVASPDQPLPIATLVGGLIDLSNYSAVLALYDNAKGKYYDQQILQGGIFSLGSADGIASINSTIAVYQQANPTNHIIIATDVVYSDFSNACLQMAIIKNSAIGDAKSSDFITIPGGNCAPIPPILITCDLSTNNLTLDHHTVSSNSVNDNTASGTITVTCSDTVKLQVSTPTPSITLTDGLDSYLYINDQSMDHFLNMDSAKNFKLNIESRLKKNGTILTGDYTGSYILIISPY